MKDVLWNSMVWNRGEQWSSMQEWHDEKIVFVKPEKVSNSSIWRLFTADGTAIGVADSKNLAFIMARQHNLIPHNIN